MSWSLDTVGPMCRTVRDVALMLNVIAGHDPRDPSSSRRPPEDFTATLEQGIVGTRIGIPREFFFDGMDPEVKDAVTRALHLAEQRSEGFLDVITEKITDLTDKLIEDAVRRPVTAIWDEIKRDARIPFENGGDGLHTIRAFADELVGDGKQIHLIGHSKGVVLLEHLRDALDELEAPVPCRVAI